MCERRPAWDRSTGSKDARAAPDGGTRSDFCAEHAWASVGVTVVEGAVTRVWSCENCPAWSEQVLDGGAEVDWAETWLSSR